MSLEMERSDRSNGRRKRKGANRGKVIVVERWEKRGEKLGRESEGNRKGNERQASFG